MIPRSGVFSSVRAHLSDPLYRNSYFLIANFALPPLLGLVFLKITTSRYPVEEVGLASSLLAILTFLSTAGRLGFETSLLQILPRMSSEDQSRYVNGALVMTGAASVITALIVVLGLPTVAPRLGFVTRDPLQLAIFLIIAVSLTWLGVLDTAAVSERASRAPSAGSAPPSAPSSYRGPSTISGTDPPC